MGVEEAWGRVAPRAAPGFAGRDAELRAAGEFLESTARRLAALLIDGEAGIGKTAVWLQVIREARDRGFRVLSCRPAQTETKFSLAAIADLVEDAPPETVGALPGPQRRALEVALLRADPGGTRLEQRQVFTAFRSLLRMLCDAGPLLVAVDDVQWLDGASARAMAFALRRLGGAPMGWLFARRADDPLRLDVEGAVAQDVVTRMPIGPLSIWELHQVLAGRLDRPLARPALSRIHRICGGNPFYALEIARGWSERSPDGPAGGVPVPDSLRGLILRRVRKLPGATRDALLACAAASEPTTALAGEQALAPAEESGLLTVDDDGHVAFCHPLYASAVYASAPRARRRQVHRRLAAMVGDAEQLARHLALAASAPDEPVALALERGAETARRRGAWESAAELLEHSSRLTPVDRVDGARWRAFAAAEHHVHSGDRARARTLLEEMLAGPLPRPLRGRALHLLAEIAHNDEHYLEARRLFVEALGQADSLRLSAECEFGLAYVDASLADFRSGAEHAQRAVGCADAAGDGPVLAESLAVRVMMNFLCGEGVDWADAERSLALEDPDRVVTLERRPGEIIALLLLYLGRHSEARRRLAGLCAQARERGDESDLSFTLLWFSWLETRSGDLPRAQRLAEEGMSVAALTGSRSNQAWLLTQQAYLAAHLGKIDEVRRMCAEAELAVAQYGSRLPVLWIAASRALSELSAGNAEAAWRACEPLVQALEQRGIGEPVPMFFLPDALEALVAMGELGRAEALIESLEQRGRELGREWALATAARCRGLLLAVRGDMVGALAALECALAEHKRMDMPFERARALLARGLVERRARQRAKAKASLAQALAEFERLGTPLFSERARDELARVGLRRASADELTEGERRVAELAALGRTNREIAASLFVSAKTVEANLARAYRKLGIGSRAELGARMSGRGQT